MDLLSAIYIATIQSQKLKNFNHLFLPRRNYDVTRNTHSSDVTIQLREKARADEIKAGTDFVDMCSVDPGNNSIMFRIGDNTFIEVDWSQLRSWLWISRALR